MAAITIKRIIKDRKISLEPLHYRILIEDIQGEQTPLNWEQWRELRKILLEQKKIEGVAVDLTDNGVRFVGDGNDRDK